MQSVFSGLLQLNQYSNETIHQVIIDSKLINLKFSKDQGCFQVLVPVPNGVGVWPVVGSP